MNNIYPPEALFEAEYRHARYFLMRLQIIGDIYEERNERTELALDHLDAEWGQISNAYHWALNNRQDTRAVEMCSQFPLAGDLILAHRQPLNERLQWLQAGISAARQLGDYLSTIRLLNTLSMTYLHQQNIPDALTVGHQALTLLDDGYGDENLLGSVLNTLCIGYYSRGDYRTSLSYLEQSMRIVEVEGDESKLMKVLGNMGILRSRLGDYSEAISLYNRTLEIARKRQSKLDIATDLCNLGVAYNDLDEHEKALKYHQEALQIARQLEDPWRIGLYLYNVALSHYSLEAYDDALHYLEEYMLHSDAIGQHHAEANMLQMASEIYALQGDIDRGLQAAQRCQMLRQDEENPYEDGELSQVFGRIYQLANRYDLAIAYYDRAVSAFLETGWKIGLARVYETLSKLHGSVGDQNSQIEYQQKALEAYQEMGHQRGIDRLTN